MPSLPSSFFVYGTLKRGQCREHVWPCEPLSVKTAWLRGELYSRVDYPALRSGEDRVQGEVWTFADHQLEQVLPVIDAIEGTDGNRPDDLYHRFTVEAFELSGSTLGQVMTYRYVRDPLSDGFVRLSPESPGTYVAWPASA